MITHPELLKTLAWRALIALPFFAAPVLGVTPLAIPFFILAGAIILAFPAAALAVELLGDSFHPGGRLTRPEPLYSIAEGKRAKGLYEEAMAALAKIAAEYPDNARPHIEMINLAIVDLKDPDRAEAIYQHGLSVLTKDDDKKELTGMYNAIRTRLHTKMSN